MFFRSKSLKFRNTVISVGFSLVLAVLITLFSFFWYRSYTRQNMIRAAEFNLQLIEGIIDRQMTSVQLLARWCSTNPQLSDYFGNSGSDTQAMLDAYDRVVEEIRNCTASYYIRRIVITNFSGKTIQAGNRMPQSLPLNAQTMRLLTPLTAKRSTGFNTIVKDPLSTEEDDFIIPVVQPVLHIYTRQLIGYVYIGVSAELFTDQLKSYYTQPDSTIYLSLGKNTYRLDGKRVVKSDLDFADAPRIPIKTVNEKTVTGEIRTGTKRHIFVRYPFRSESVYFTQIMSREQDVSQILFFIRITAVIVLALVLFALLLRKVLTGLIDIPVTQLQRRMEIISSGDFSFDPSIEWNNELGTIGKGINSLSQNVRLLMQNKLDSEKQKRELEYRMLESQINPHFLYNTLNSIRWMATIQNAPGIAEMVTALAALLKNISNNTAEELPLRNELSLLDDYFTIQKYRYGGSISMTVDTEDKRLLDAVIPRFTLQPVIENAIFHGIEPKDTAGIIAIRVAHCTVQNRTDDVEIDITDNGVGMSRETIDCVLVDASGNRDGLFRHVGLSNVNRRLIFAFGEKYGLSIASEAGSYTRVTILLPGPEDKPV
ncbi:MAG TPA: hypothetical protein DCL73_17135 [Treponema sp.]|nr:hypothetical protein [Treponema sp.]